MSTDNYIGTCLDGRFQILSLIGEGGTSYLYLAKHLLMDKLVAVKVLKFGAAASEPYLQRFQREAKTATLLDHPNIARVDAFGVTEKGPFIAMDYIDGQPLSKLLETDGKLSPAVAVRLFGKIADALSHAHGKGVIHRDLKPSNIMLTKSADIWEPKIVDFGIAKLIAAGEVSASQQMTQTGQLLGTPSYMSPEQVSGKRTDARTDIYSLGCVLYEALTGSPPFDGNTALEIMYKHLNDPLPSASGLPPDLQALLKKALQKNRDDRYASMDEMAMDLAACRDLEKTYSIASKKDYKLILIPVVSLVVVLPIITFLFFPKLASEDRPPSRPVVIPKKLISSIRDVLDQGEKLAVNDPQAALKQFLLAVQMSETGMPLEEESRSNLYNRVGSHYLFMLNNTKEAEVWFNKALRNSDKFDEKDSFFRANLMQNLGDMHGRRFLETRNKGEFDKAAKYFAEAEQIFAARGVKGLEPSAWLFSKIGMLHAYRGDYKTADQYLARSVVLMKDNTDERLYWVGAANSQASVLELQQKWAEALAVYRNTVTWAEGRKPVDLGTLASQQIYVARTLQRLNQLNEARDAYRQGLKNFLLLKQFDRITYDAAEYGRLLQSMGKTEEAKIMRKLSKNPTMQVSDIP